MTDIQPRWKRTEQERIEFVDPLRANIWQFIIPAVASLAGGYLSGQGEAAAANEEAKAAKNTLGLQRDIYQDQRQLARPGYMTGGAATNILAGQFGIPGQDYGAAYGAGTTGQDDQWNSYLQANPDVAQEWSRLQTQGKNPFGSAAEYAQYHWNTYGQKEGRQLPQQNTQSPQPVAGGAAAGPMNPLKGFMDSPYGQIATSGFRGVDVPEVNSAFARGGKVLSGAQSIALDERGKARLGGAYTDYTNGLRSLAGMNQTASSQVSGAAQNFGVNAGNAMQNIGTAKGNALAGAYQGIGQGISGALGSVMDFGKKNWGWT